MAAYKLQMEQSILVRFKKGEINAFNHLYAVYKPVLTAFTQQYIKNIQITEEIVQDVFLTIWEKHEEIKESLSFKSYLFTITQNKITDYFRKAKTETIYKNYIQNFVDSAESEQINRFLKDNFNKQLNQVIKLLPEKRRMVLILSKKFDLSREEIAMFMGVSENTVKNQLHEALEFLKEHIKSDVVLIVIYCISAQIINN